MFGLSVAFSAILSHLLPASHQVHLFLAPNASVVSNGSRGGCKNTTTRGPPLARHVSRKSYHAAHSTAHGERAISKILRTSADLFSRRTCEGPERKNSVMRTMNGGCEEGRSENDVERTAHCEVARMKNDTWAELQRNERTPLNKWSQVTVQERKTSFSCRPQ